MAELAVHGCIEHGVDATIEPGEIGSEHVDNPRSLGFDVQDVEQQEGDVAQSEAEEHSKTHPSYLPKLGWRVRSSLGSFSWPGLGWCFWMAFLCHLLSYLPAVLVPHF